MLDIQLLNLGTEENDNTGDTLRDGGQKINQNLENIKSEVEITPMTAKTSLADADVTVIEDSQASDVKKKVSWSTIKTVLQAYFDTIYSTLTLGETETTAYRGDRGMTAYDHSQAAHAPSDSVAQSRKLEINSQTGTTYTTVLADAGKLIRCNNANAITVTIPHSDTVDYDTGTVLSFEQVGAGTVTLEGAASVTLNALDDGLTSQGQYAGLQAIKVDTNTWTVLGGKV